MTELTDLLKKANIAIDAAMKKLEEQDSPPTSDGGAKALANASTSAVPPLNIACDHMC